MVGDPLIDVLVMSTKQRDLVAPPESLGVRVREHSPAWRQENDRRASPDRFHRLEERLGLHHHPGSATVWRVIDRAVFVVREVAQVDYVVVDTPRLPRTG